MLRSLNIRNYILIDSLEVEFPEGLIIITGQTGAGKSILLGALSMVAGAKADASVVGQNADNCVVEAEFDSVDERTAAILVENEVEGDGDSLIVRRVISRSGRSRCFINDCPVQASVLQAVAGRLVDIHSQHKSLLLTDKDFQLSILDSFAGNGGLLKDTRSLWRQLGAARSELAALKDRLGRLSSDRDYNNAQWEQLNTANLMDGELEELEEELKLLSNAEQIKESLSAAAELFEPLESRSLDASLKEVRRQLEHVSSCLPSAAELAGRIDSARLELSDILDEITNLDSGIDLSREHLQEVEDRLSLLYSLMKKNSCRSISELIAARERYSESLFDSDSIEDRIRDLEKGIAELQRAYSGNCSVLGDSRRKAAPVFSSEIVKSLHFLELDRSVFEVRLSNGPESAEGTDRVEFLFSSTGTSLMDVSRCASGGEISRIMLCLKSMMAKFVGMPTLIFDEIDTGVSGSVADKMGSMICSMGRDMQVFSITHLPQVAAKGDAHYVVEKKTSGDRTVSSIRELAPGERVMEIARLLSGATITDAAVANAESLLKGC